MKVSSAASHLPNVAVGALFNREALGDSERPAIVRPPATDDTVSLDFDAVYESSFEHVCRWLRAHGIPSSDREDVAQEVFLVVQKKLPAFDGRHLAAWLYKITKNTASDHRRRAWFKNLFRKQSDFIWDAAVDRSATPEMRAVSRDALRMVNAALVQMDDDRRAAFVLFEIEGYSGEEIAAFQNIPLATVWTRLHYARKEFSELAARLEEKS